MELSHFFTCIICILNAGKPMGPSDCKLPLLLGLLFIVCQTSGQDFVGRWEGSLQHTSCVKTTNSFLITLELYAEGSRFPGVFRILAPNANVADTLAPSIFQFYVKAVPDSNNLTVKYGPGDEIFRRRYNYGYELYGNYKLLLTYSKANGIEKLSGYFGTSNGAVGNIYLSRTVSAQNAAQADHAGLLAAIRAKQQAAKTKDAAGSVVIASSTPYLDRGKKNNNEPPGTRALNDENNEEEKKSFITLNQRKKNIQHVLSIKDSSYADIAIYDNAVYDGDIVSLYADTTLLLYKAEVSERALQLRIYKPARKNFTVLQMLAENLGEIPPNTALLIITSGTFREAIRVTSDDYQNGSIVIKWE